MEILTLVLMVVAIGSMIAASYQLGALVTIQKMNKNHRDAIDAWQAAVSALNTALKHENIAHKILDDAERARGAVASVRVNRV